MRVSRCDIFSWLQRGFGRKWGRVGSKKLHRLSSKELVQLIKERDPSLYEALAREIQKPGERRHVLRTLKRTLLKGTRKR